VTPPTVYCIFCGTPFQRKWHGSRANVCSPECREAQKKKRKREDYARSKLSRIPVKAKTGKLIPCLRCKKPFESESRENRLCKKCTNINVILDARSYAPIYEIAIPASKARRASV
jgi:predicted nucleic acid-binding Zn ribbon protein